MIFTYGRIVRISSLPTQGNRNILVYLRRFAKAAADRRNTVPNATQDAISRHFYSA